MSEVTDKFLASIRANQNATWWHNNRDVKRLASDYDALRIGNETLQRAYSEQSEAMGVLKAERNLLEPLLEAAEEIDRYHWDDMEAADESGDRMPIVWAVRDAFDAWKAWTQAQDEGGGG